MATTYNPKYRAAPDILEYGVNQLIGRGVKNAVDFGSGLSTVIWAPWIYGEVWAYDHHANYASQTRRDAAEKALFNVRVQHCPLGKNGFYDVNTYPTDIGFVFVDGPPSDQGKRDPALPAVYDNLVGDWMVLVDDGNRESVKAAVEAWVEHYPVKAEFLNMERGAWVITPDAVS